MRLAVCTTDSCASELVDGGDVGHAHQAVERFFSFGDARCQARGLSERRHCAKRNLESAAAAAAATTCRRCISSRAPTAAQLPFPRRIYASRDARAFLRTAVEAFKEDGNAEVLFVVFGDNDFSWRYPHDVIYK